MPERQLLGDDASARETGDMRGRDVERPQHAGRVVGHRLHRGRGLGHRRASGAAVVEGGHPVAVGEPVQLELPGLDGVAEAADEQHVGPLADLLRPDVQPVSGHVPAHGQLPSAACQRRMCSACEAR